MKKPIFVLIFMGTFSNITLAQSSMTVYGIVDVGVAYKNAGTGKSLSLNSGLNSTSRLGLKGFEILINGWKANFNLEMGLKSDTGANDAALFARGAMVGLSSDEIGSVNFGRHKSLTDIYGAQIGPFSDGLLGKADLLLKINIVRDNSITYTSNSMNGLIIAAQYGFGEKAGDATANRVISLAGHYVNGPLMANMIWDEVQGANGRKAVDGGKLLAGVAYDFGMFKAHGMYEEIKGTVSLTNLDETKEQLYVVGATVKNGNNTFMVSYTDSKVKTSINSDSSRLALGYTYDFSKRTNLYASMAHVKNEKAVKTMADVAGATANLFNFGIRHKF
jgi:general bacterial porin, GBP family